MKHRFLTTSVQALLLIILTSMLCSCGDSTQASDPAPSPGTSTSTTSNSDSSNTDSNASDSTTENTSHSSTVYLSSADGTTVYGNDLVSIDASHLSDGYVMVKYTGENTKVKLQLTGPDAVTYTYNLHEDYETFPLTAGDGSYTIGVYENIEGTSYATVFTQSVDVSLTNEFGPFLYANQYVNFTASSAAVSKACELANDTESDIEIVQNVYNYVIENFTYDYDKAENVQSGYLPDVDEIFASQTGICFDYAAVMATMLRTQDIPTRLEVGYMGDVYHAWISVYTDETGWINGIIAFDGTKWELMDPTFASTSNSPKDFITSSDKYQTKYVY